MLTFTHLNSLRIEFAEDLFVVFIVGTKTSYHYVPYIALFTGKVDSLEVNM